MINDIVAAKIAEGPSLLEKFQWLLELNKSTKLTPTAKVVAAYLVDRTHSARGYAYPSYETIANNNGISKRAAMYAIEALDYQGWFEVTRTATGTGQQKSNHYMPVWDRCLRHGEYSAPVQKPRSSAPKPMGVQNLHSPVQYLHSPVQYLHSPGAESAPVGVQKTTPYTYEVYTSEETSEETEEGDRASACADASPFEAPEGTGCIMTDYLYEEPF